MISPLSSVTAVKSLRFFFSISGHDLGFWDRDDELASPGPEDLKVLDDLLREVPRQDERVIGLKREQGVIGHHGDMRSRSVPADLEVRLLGNDLKGLRAQPAEIKKGHALGRRADADDALAAFPEFCQKLDELHPMPL